MTCAVSRLRIALVRQKFRFDGGGERIVGHISDVLRRHGHQVSLIARKWDGADQEVVSCDPPQWTRVQRDAGFARRALELAEQHRFDLVQSHERIPGCEVYRAGDGVQRDWLEQRCRPMPVWRQKLLFRNGYHRYLLNAERELFEHPRLRAVICNARMVADEILEHFQIEPDKLHVIYNGVDTNHFHPNASENRDAVCHKFSLDSGSSIALFVGSGWERKGLSQVLNAIHQTKGISLLVVGRDKSQRKFEKLVARNGLRDRIRFAGVQREVARLYGAADFFVLPTLYDPFPNAVMEAMASGLPILTTPRCGAIDVLRHGENGFVIDALDESGWREQIRECRDRDYCRELGRHARQMIEPMTIEAMRENLTSLYRQLLSSA